MADFIPFDGRQDLIEFSDGYSGESYYWGADGDEYYNAKGEKVKDFFKKIGKGLGKGVKGVGKGLKKVGQAIVNAERKLIGKNKNKVAGTSEKKGTDLPAWLLPQKGGSSNELTQQKTSDGKDILTNILKPATSTTPAEQVVTIEGQKLSTVGVPADKPIVVSTDPTTGQKTIGVDYKPEEVTAVQGNDGNYTYYPTNKVGGNTDDTNKGMSTTTKIAIAVGGVVVVGLIVYLIAKKK
jgi:hypothetical protein